MLYPIELAPRHTLALPDIKGKMGAEPTDTARLPLLLPQLFTTVTETVPATAELVHVVVMLLVPWPAVMVTPVGTAQL